MTQRHAHTQASDIANHPPHLLESTATKRFLVAKVLPNPDKSQLKKKKSEHMWLFDGRLIFTSLSKNIKFRI